MESIDRMVNAVVSHVADAASSGLIASEPLQIGEITLVVLSMLSVGMGAGGGEGQGDEGKRAKAPGTGMGEGVGGGVKVRPAAVVAFTADGVQVLPIPAPPNAFDKVVERVPAVVDMVEKARHALQ